MSNSLRITGLATGLDTDNMVKQMMKPYNMKLDKMKQDKQVVQWRQDLYRDIIKDVMDLRDTFMNSLKSDTNMLSSNTYAAFEAKVASGGEDKLTLTTYANAIPGDYKINIDNLATKARIEGKKLERGSEQATLTTKINELKNNPTSIAKTLQIDYGMEIPPAISEQITIDDNSTIGSVINAINNSTKLKGKVSARFSELTGSIILESVAMGSNEKISITDPNNSGTDPVNPNALQVLGIDINDALKASPIGSDANVRITPPGGSEVPITRSTNSFTIDGVNYNLLEKGSTSFTVNPSEQKTFEKLTKFIDKYNALVEKLNVKLSEKREYSYRPLTDEQKKDMKEDEIKKWEEKAKSGLLNGDSTLEKLKTSLRQAFFDKVDGANLSFSKADIGLDTAPRYKDAGKIVISDEAKFREAIRNKPQEVMDLFMKLPSSNSTGTTKYKESGIVRRLNDIITDNVGVLGGVAKGALIDKAGYEDTASELTNILTLQLNEQEKRIRKYESTLSSKENKFYMQFATLEKSMNQMNSQSSWLSQQLGGMG